MDINDPIFQKYVAHVLKWEGLTSDDPNDTASSCYPFGIHTNKGVTYCTFKQYAASLGITPVTHDRFLALTNNDVAKFVFLFMEKAEASPLPTPVALSVTEAAWASGPDRAVRHLQDAINDLKGPGTPIAVDGDSGPQTQAAALAVNASDLFNQYWLERKKYLDYLISHGYSRYANGWYNRVNDFLENFAPASGGTILTAVLIIVGVLLAFKQ